MKSQDEFEIIKPFHDRCYRLISEMFSFYTDILNLFFRNLGSEVEANSLDGFLKYEIRKRLFDSEYCKTIENLKRAVLIEDIKLEQFIEEHDSKGVFHLIFTLKQITSAIYELLQSHWEFFKYEKTIVNSELLIAFLLEIDRIENRLNLHLETYKTISMFKPKK